LVKLIWPRQAAVLHSFDSPVASVTCRHLMPLRTLAATISFVTSSRHDIIRFLQAVGG
jgi:hypothetical protein